MLPEVNLTRPTICFKSNGGDRSDASVLAELIVEYSIATCTADKYIIYSGEVLTNNKCQSVCSMLLIMDKSGIALGEQIVIATHRSVASVYLGTRRFIFDPIGVNHYYFGPTVNSVNNRDRYKHLAFLKLGAMVGFADNHILSRAELIEFGVFTEYRT